MHLGDFKSDSYSFDKLILNSDAEEQDEMMIKSKLKTKKSNGVPK